MNSHDTDPVKSDTPNHRCDPSQLWYAATTLPHMDKAAAARLADQGFEVFMPLQKRTVRHARRLSTVCRPVFPGYLFIHMDTKNCRWRSVNGTVGVRHLITAGNRPLAVREGIIEALQAATDAKGLLRPNDGLKRGDKVRLLEGPFADQVGTLLSLNTNDRCQVLISWLGGEVPMQTKANQLAKAG